MFRLNRFIPTTVMRPVYYGLSFFSPPYATAQHALTPDQRVREVLANPNLNWVEATIDQRTVERIKNEHESMSRHTNY